MSKKNKSNLGRALINDRFKKTSTAKRTKDPSILHSSEVPDGYDWGRLNLQSVTEESSFQEFLSTAQLVETEFQAEKLNITFVNPLTGSGLLTKQEKEKLDKTKEENKHFLSIPRRPKWDARTTPEQLCAAENENFLNWRRGLAILQEEKGLILTPYEKNLEFWRQLWRVVERSDIVVQIVDARNPLLFRCEDLEKYVSEVSPHKQNLILLNKSDFLTEAQRQVWANYFGDLGVRVAFYSASKALDEGVDSKKVKDNEVSDKIDDKEIDSDKMVEDQVSTKEELSQDGELDDNIDERRLRKVGEIDNNITQNQEGDERTNERNNGSDLVVAIDNLNIELNIHENAIHDKAIEENKKQFSNTGKRDVEWKNNLIDENICGQGETCSSSESNTMPSTQSVCDKKVYNSHKLLGQQELISLFHTMHNDTKVTSGITTVGLVGYPNVGKSSTINSLLLEKKVSVSATPGKTKHFQTLYLDENLLLCDCPGLVMPSFVYSKAEMIVSGILPIDRMRDHVPPITLVTSLIPRHILEDTYGLMIPLPREGEDPERPPTSEELLNAYGYNRGFMTENGQPDNPRGSRYILKDFVSGKLLYCQAPPGFPQEEFHVFPERKKHVEEKRQKSKLTTKSSELDFAFFNPSSSNAHIKGRHLSAATGKSQSNDGSKPLKDHSAKRNKREKLRRIYCYLDKP